MVGTDDNNIARVGAHIDATNVPPGYTVQARIAFRDNSGNIIPFGGMDSYSSGTALLSIDVPGSGNSFFVVAWLDDGSGYSSGAIQDDTSDRWTIYLVSDTVYNDDVNFLATIFILGPYFWSDQFLSAFVNDTAIEDATSVVASQVANDNIPYYYHNTGVVWQGSNPSTGPTRKNVFSSTNLLADNIRSDPDFNALIQSTLTNNKSIVQFAQQHSWPSDNKFTFAMPDTIVFLNHGYPDNDLYYAIGDGHSQNLNLIATVDKTTLNLVQLDIHGSLYDLYDFDVEITDSLGLSPAAARTQAGYNPNGGHTAGHVFEILVILDKLNVPCTFNFGP